MILPAFVNINAQAAQQSVAAKANNIPELMLLD
jgi:hypothetical protein